MNNRIAFLCKEIIAAAFPYLENPEDRFNSIHSNAASFSYGKGGMLMHRGFYCPSPIIDIIVGNINRGKLYKRLTSKTLPDFEYGFDSAGQLSTVHLYNCHKEFIFRNGNTEVGLRYHLDDIRPPMVDTISLCNYSGDRLVSYSLSSYSHSRQSVINGSLEEYVYADGVLDSVYVLDYFRTQMNTWGFGYCRYCFQHDDDGYLSSYTYQRLDEKGNAISLPPQTYKVFLKRKI